MSLAIIKKPSQPDPEGQTTIWIYLFTPIGWKRKYTYADALLLLCMSLLIAAVVGLSVTAVNSRRDWVVEKAQ